MSNYLEITTPNGDVQINEIYPIISLKNSSVLGNYYMGTYKYKFSIDNHLSYQSREVHTYLVPVDSYVPVLCNPTTTQAYVWTCSCGRILDTKPKYQTLLGVYMCIAIYGVSKIIADSFILFQFGQLSPNDVNENCGLEVFNSSGVRIFSSGAGLLNLVNVSYKQVQDVASFEPMSVNSSSKIFGYWNSIPFVIDSEDNNNVALSKCECGIITKNSITTTLSTYLNLDYSSPSSSDPYVTGAYASVGNVTPWTSSFGLSYIADVTPLV